MFDWFARLIGRPEGWPKDKVRVREKITYRLIDPTTGKVVKERTRWVNTWSTTGINAIAEAMADGTSVAITYMYENGGGTEKSVTATHAANIAQFVATWLSAEGPFTITSFSLRHTSGGTFYSTGSVTSFTKPVGLELQVTWQTTVTST